MKMKCVPVIPYVVVNVVIVLCTRSAPRDVSTNPSSLVETALYLFGTFECLKTDGSIIASLMHSIVLYGLQITFLNES